jgi:hypothetical protein
MIAPPVGRRCISAALVVCRPSPVAADSVAVAESRPGSSAFSNEDFPTPDCPTRMLVCPSSVTRRTASPVSVRTLVRSTV